jgi:glycine hydroxymethyltransferase
VLPGSKGSLAGEDAARTKAASQRKPACVDQWRKLASVLLPRGLTLAWCVAVAFTTAARAAGADIDWRQCTPARSMPSIVPHLAPRPWLPDNVAARIRSLVRQHAALDGPGLLAELSRLVEDNHRLHDREAFNLNPASNVMNPRAEALMASGLGTRASLGYPGDKYETGLDAIEQIEVMAAELAATVFDASHVELRVASGAMANLYVFMATARPGAAIIAPPPAIGGHVTHQRAGAAGLYGLVSHPAPVDAGRYTVDLDALRKLAHALRPALITLGGSLNLFEHPIAEVRAICDEVGALLMFDAAHLSGLFAGRAWRNPLDAGAHVMTMSTYKSLGGPPGGLVVTRDAALAQRIEAIAYPGLSANFDAGKTAALACTLVDWVVHGQAYARAMIDTAMALATALHGEGLPVFAIDSGGTRSHQVALQAAGGGQAMARLLGQAGLLCCGIGLPMAEVPGDLNGLRLGTPEIVRLGLTPADMPRLARLIARALATPSRAAAVRDEITAWRRALDGLHYVVAAAH